MEIECDILIHPGNSFQGLSSATQETHTMPCEQHSRSETALIWTPEFLQLISAAKQSKFQTSTRTRVSHPESLCLFCE